MALLVVLMGKQGYLLLFTDLRLGRRRMKTPRKPRLKLCGSLKRGRLVVHDDGSLLPCAIHAACAALVDAGIPLKYLAVAISCCVVESGHILLDPSKLEEQKMKAFVCLAFPCSVQSVLPEGSISLGGESIEQGIITSLTHGVMTGDAYFQCVEQGRAAVKPLSNILKKKLQSISTSNLSSAG